MAEANSAPILFRITVLPLVGVRPQGSVGPYDGVTEVAPRCRTGSVTRMVFGKATHVPATPRAIVASAAAPEALHAGSVRLVLDGLVIIGRFA